MRQQLLCTRTAADGVRVGRAAGALLACNYIAAGSIPSQPAVQVRTCAGTHTIHSALRESQISERYFSAAADSGWPLTPAWWAEREGQGRGRLGGMQGRWGRRHSDEGKASQAAAGSRRCTVAAPQRSRTLMAKKEGK